MKKILLFLTIAILSGCATTQLTNKEEEFKTFAIDFRKYADKDFLFMPDEYYGEYDVLGIITAEMHPEVVYREGQFEPLRGFSSSIIYTAEKTYTQVVKDIDIDKLIEYVYNLSVEWGGDAFTHFETKFQVGKTDESPYSTYTYYSISGIVIKRK
jgi:hypothetical protein